MTRDPFELLKRADYAAIASIARAAAVDPEADPVGIYVEARACMLTGARDHALARIEVLRGSDTAMASLAEAHLAALGNDGLEEALERLLGYRDHFSATPYLQAECLFALGYLSMRLDRNEGAIRFLQQAQTGYEAARLPGLVAASLFNLFVCANHVGRRSLAEEATRKLAELEGAVEVASLLHQRALAYSALDREEYSEADRLLEGVAACAESLARVTDRDSARSLQAYVSLKRQDLGRFDAIARAGTGSAFARRLDALASTIARGAWDYETASECLEAWASRGIDATSLIFVADLLMDALLRCREFGDAIRFYELARKATRDGDQSSMLVDFRVGAAEAMLRSGRASDAASLLARYQEDARAQGSAPKQAKAAALVLETGAGEHPALELDLVGHRLKVGTRVVALSRKPLIENFLRILIAAGGKLEMGAFFERIYGVPFHPVLHEARFHSLVERVRESLGERDLLLRRDGALELRGGSKAKLLETGTAARRAPRKRKSPDARREGLLRFIERSTDPVTITQLEERSRLTRRTLQLDLRELVERGAIRRIGEYNLIRYVVERASS